MTMGLTSHKKELNTVVVGQDGDDNDVTVDQDGSNRARHLTGRRR